MCLKAGVRESTQRNHSINHCITDQSPTAVRCCILIQREKQPTITHSLTHSLVAVNGMLDPWKQFGYQSTDGNHSINHRIADQSSAPVRCCILIQREKQSTITHSLDHQCEWYESGLGENQLTGTIPSTTASLINLQYLYVPKLQSYPSLTHVILLDSTDSFLYTNQLNGTIPSTIASLTKLKELYVIASGVRSLAR